MLLLNRYYLISTHHGPLICAFFRNVRMRKKGVSCVLCLCSFSSCPHLWCYKTSKGLFSVFSRLLCHSSVSEWGATRHQRLCAPCPLTHTSFDCVPVLKSAAATAVQPLSVFYPFQCMQTKHTHQMLAYPYKDMHGCFAYLYILPEAIYTYSLSQDKFSTCTNITLTVIFMLYCIKTCSSWMCKGFTCKVIWVRL